MRHPHPDLQLMISGKAEVAQVGVAFDDIVDCTTEGVQHLWMPAVLHCPPTGKNDHNWTVEDLDTIVELVKGCLDQDRKVLIHCGRGVSRSTCAAAAVLLYLGKAQSVEEAVALTRHPERAPVKTALASLEAWWLTRRNPKLPL